MTITKEQIKTIHAILPREIVKDKSRKQEIVQDFTEDGAKTSTKDLSFNQANDLIIAFGGRPHVNQWLRFDIENNAHRNVLSLLQQMGWVRWNGKRHVADMYRFAEWLKSDKSPVKKPLNDQTKTEISKTIVALEGILKHTLK